MTILNISLSESAKRYVEEQLARGGYSSSSEYIELLIKEAMLRDEEELMEEGFNSGPTVKLDDADMAAIEQEARARAAQLRGK